MTVMDIQITQIKPEPHTLPTPPYSPTPEQRAVASSSVVLLSDLQSFYQSRSVWVHRTRAALELALVSQGRAALPAPVPALALVAPQPLQPTPPTSDDEHEHEPSDPRVKAEPSTPPPIGRSNAQSRWLQRKKSFKLKLEGIQPSSLSRRRHSRRSPNAPSAHETGTRLLDLFGQLMEARMESCNRVHRLVQEAHRPDAVYC